MDDKIDNLDRFEKMLSIQEGGFVLIPYKDTAGKLTASAGVNIEKLYPEEAMFLFKNRVRIATMGANALPFFKTLDDVRQDVVRNMIYNLGVTRFLQFAKMIQALNEKDFDKAAVEMLDSAWASEVGRRSLVLASMMRTGMYP